jgi:hypothetical protein
MVKVSKALAQKLKKAINLMQDKLLLLKASQVGF